MDLPDEETAKVAADKARAKLFALREQETLRKVCALYEGREFLWSMISLCGVYSDTFYGEATHAAARASGKRSLGIILIEQIFRADPQAYNLMRIEAERRTKELNDKAV